MNGSENEKIAVKVSKNTIALNVVLSAFKLFAGIFSNSSAMISDAVHSVSDVVSTIIVIIGVKLANKESDHDHPYGHERLEYVVAIILSAILCITGIVIGYKGITKILTGNYDSISAPKLLALLAAVVSILIKEAMYWYTRKAAVLTGYGSLMADAWHHRSDSLSSIGSFIGILGARLGFPVFDPLASLIICIFIVKAAFDIFTDAIHKLTDKACDEETVEMMRNLILEELLVLKIDMIRTRQFGNRIYMELELSVDGSMSLRQSHSLAHKIKNRIENAFEKVKECMIHINPSD